MRKKKRRISAENLLLIPPERPEVFSVRVRYSVIKPVFRCFSVCPQAPASFRFFYCLRTSIEPLKKKKRRRRTDAAAAREFLIWLPAARLQNIFTAIYTRSRRAARSFLAPIAFIYIYIGGKSFGIRARAFFFYEPRAFLIFDGLHAVGTDLFTALIFSLACFSHALYYLSPSVCRFLSIYIAAFYSYSYCFQFHRGGREDSKILFSMRRYRRSSKNR